VSNRIQPAIALLVGIVFAVLTPAVSTLAQPPATSPVVKPADTVQLTMEERHIIKELILKDLKIQPQKDAAAIPTQVGQTVPSGIPLQPMPVEVAAKVPQIKSHSFVVKGDEVVIVDPKNNKVAALIK
jgi:hypothetical protein